MTRGPPTRCDGWAFRTHVMPAPAVRVDVRPDGVAVLTIDQPGGKVNVLTSELWADLEAALDALAGRTDLRGLVVASGKPGVFIAGADLKLLAAATGPNDPAVRAFIGHGLRVLAKLDALPFPTCAAVDGVALGGGLEVALACDLVVCGTHPKVRLGMPEVTLGLIPGWGGTQRLPRVVGLELAAEMLVAGKTLAAGEAHDAGIDGFAPSDRPIDRAADLVLAAPFDRAVKWKPLAAVVPAADYSRLDLGAPAAREAVRVMCEGTALPLAEGIALETEAFLRLAGSAESRRLIAAFFAGRKG